jgi:hypothetical protein
MYQYATDYLVLLRLLGLLFVLVVAASFPLDSLRSLLNALRVSLALRAFHQSASESRDLLGGLVVEQAVWALLELKSWFSVASAS